LYLSATVKDGVCRTGRGSSAGAARLGEGEVRDGRFGANRGLPEQKPTPAVNSSNLVDDFGV